MIINPEEMYCWKPMGEWFKKWEWQYKTVWELIDKLWEFDKSLKVLIRRTHKWNDEADCNPEIDLMIWQLRWTDEDILLID